MTGSVVIYHNPRCSKSRAALDLLRSRGIAPRIVLYLETPPDAATIDDLLRRLDLPPRALIRSGEAEYGALGLAAGAVDDAALVAAMASHPRLIERPIVVRGERAVIARPAERLLALLD